MIKTCLNIVTFDDESTSKYIKNTIRNLPDKSKSKDELCAVYISKSQYNKLSFLDFRRANRKGWTINTRLEKEDSYSD